MPRLEVVAYPRRDAPGYYEADVSHLSKRTMLALRLPCGCSYSTFVDGRVAATMTRKLSFRGFGKCSRCPGPEAFATSTIIEDLPGGTLTAGTASAPFASCPSGNSTNEEAAAPAIPGSADADTSLDPMPLLFVAPPAQAPDPPDAPIAMIPLPEVPGRGDRSSLSLVSALHDAAPTEAAEPYSPRSPIVRRVTRPGVAGPILFNRSADASARKRAEAAALAAAADAAATSAWQTQQLQAPVLRQQPAPVQRTQPPASADIKELIPDALQPAKRVAGPAKAPPLLSMANTSSASTAAARLAAQALAQEKRDEVARARARSSKMATSEAVAMLYASSSFESGQEQSPMPRARRRA